jgi:hypothetical protein
MTLGRIPVEAQPASLFSPMRAAQQCPAAGPVGPSVKFIPGRGYHLTGYEPKPNPIQVHTR